MTRSGWTALLWTLVFAAGVGAAFVAYPITREERLRGLILDARRGAAAFPNLALDAIEGRPEDSEALGYELVKERLMLLRSIDPGVRFCYLMRRLPDGRVIYLADSEPADSEDLSQPGDPFAEAAASYGLQVTLATGEPSWEGPLADEFGTWMTAFAVAARTPEGAVRDVFGLDIDASGWRRDLTLQALKVAAYVWLTLGLPLAVWTSVRKKLRLVKLLRTAKEEAEAGYRSKSRFLATMSHEIRTPLNGMMGVASVLGQMPMPREQRELVEVISRSGESLLVIINDILDISRIDSGKVELENRPFGLRACFSDVDSLFQPLARAKGLSLSIQVAENLPAFATGDETRLRQVLTNLVSNALKFTEKGSIRVSADAAAGEAGHLTLRFAVADTGIGIPADKKARLFSSFSQADASITRRFGGTGLGLAICKRLCELMDGTISLESEPGRGTTFRVELQLARYEGPDLPAAPEPTPPATARLRALRVLVVEDNAVNRLVMKKMLGLFGIAPDLAEDGEAACDAVQRSSYDVVLMDLEMPRLDGLSATRRIRTLELPVQPWIIAVTADALAGDREKCMAAGMDDYVTKPVVAELLKDALLRAEPRQRELSHRP